MHVSRQTAIKVIYWHTVFAVIVVCLGIAFFIRRIHRYDTLIVKVSRDYKLDPRLIASVIWVESRFDPVETGKAGEVGLMQVTEVAGREWAEATGFAPFSRQDLFNPEINVRAGAWYLARAIEHWTDYSKPLPLALAEYNAGRSNARRWAEIAEKHDEPFRESITYPTTRRYIRDVLKRYRGASELKCAMKCGTKSHF